MSGLDSKCRALLDAGRMGDEPGAADQERVRRALVSRLAGAAVVGAAVGAGIATKTGVAVAAGNAAKAGVVGAGAAGVSVAGTGSAVATAGLLKFVGIGLAVGVTTVGAIELAPSLGPSKSAAPAVSFVAPLAQRLAEPAPQKPRVEPVAPVAEAPAVVEDAVPVATNLPSKPSVSSSAAVTSTLDDEITLIRSAQRALHSGQASSALGILSEHAKRYPTGLMREDRVALQVLALCASGRSGEARAQASRFLTTHPRSPYAGPVSSCAEPKAPVP